MSTIWLLTSEGLFVYYWEGTVSPWDRKNVGTIWRGGAKRFGVPTCWYNKSLHNNPTKRVPYTINLVLYFDRKHISHLENVKLKCGGNV